MGQSRKLNPLFTGPYLVVKVLSPYLYRVRDRKKTLVLHHDRLKICEERAVPFWVRRRRHDLFRRLDNEDQTSQVVGTSQASVAEPQEAMLESRDLEETLPYSVTEEAAKGESRGRLGCHSSIWHGPRSHEFHTRWTGGRSGGHASVWHRGTGGRATRHSFRRQSFRRASTWEAPMDAGGWVGFVKSLWGAAAHERW